MVNHPNRSKAFSFTVDARDPVKRWGRSGDDCAPGARYAARVTIANAAGTYHFYMVDDGQMGRSIYNLDLPKLPAGASGEWHPVAFRGMGSVNFKPTCWKYWREFADVEISRGEHAAIAFAQKNWHRIRQTDVQDAARKAVHGAKEAAYLRGDLSDIG